MQGHRALTAHGAESPWALHPTNSFCPPGKRDRGAVLAGLPPQGQWPRCPAQLSTALGSAASPGRHRAGEQAGKEGCAADGREEQREGETTEGAETALSKGWNGCEEHQLQITPVTEREMLGLQRKMACLRQHQNEPSTEQQPRPGPAWLLALREGGKGLGLQNCSYGKSNLLGNGSIKGFKTQDIRGRTRCNCSSRKQNKCFPDPEL